MNFSQKERFEITYPVEWSLTMSAVAQLELSTDEKFAGIPTAKNSNLLLETTRCTQWRNVSIQTYIAQLELSTARLHS